MTTTETEPTYLFGPRDRRDAAAGHAAAPARCSAMGASLPPARASSVRPVRRPARRAACIASRARVAFAPVQGRPLVDWMRPIANFLHGRVTGQGSYLGGPWAVHAPTQGARELCALRASAAGSGSASFDTAQGEVAVIRQGSRWTAVLQVTAPAYPLADRATQHERVSAWGSLLAQLGQEGSRLAAIQWLERTIPDSGRGLEDWWRAKGCPVGSRAPSTTNG